MLPGPPMSAEFDVMNAHLDALEIVIRIDQAPTMRRRVQTDWIDSVRNLAQIIDNRAEST